MAFDGVTNAVNTSSAAENNNIPVATAGKTFPSPVAIDYAMTYGANDAGYINNANPSVTLTLYAKQGAAPATPTDGTVLGSLTFTDTSTTNPKTIDSGDKNTRWDHVWLGIAGNGSSRLAELQLYGWA